MPITTTTLNNNTAPVIYPNNTPPKPSQMNFVKAYTVISKKQDTPFLSAFFPLFNLNGNHFILDPITPMEMLLKK